MPKSTLRYQRQIKALQQELQDTEQLLHDSAGAQHPSLKARKASILRSLRWYASRQERPAQPVELHKAQRRVQAGA